MKWKWLGLVVLLVALAMVGYWRREWDGRTRFSVVSVGREIEVLSFDPQTKLGVRMKLPENLEVETVGGRGRIKSGNLVRAGQKFGGTRWVADSVADYIGIAYTGEERHLGWWDRWLWWWMGREVNWSDISTQVLGWMREMEAVDGEKFLVFSDAWAQERGKWFLDSAVAAEGMSVTMVNTTSTNGLGSHAAIAFETAGMRVREIRTEARVLEKCRVWGGKDTRKRAAAGWIIKNYSCQWGTDDKMSDEEMVVELGGDYRKWWLGE
mgnify:CR=1 FL=1